MRQLLAVFAILTPFSCIQQSRIPNPVAVSPYPGVRFIGNSLKAAQVESLTFTGPSVGAFGGAPVSDPLVVEAFLVALRDATRRRALDVGNKDCSMTIHLRPSKGKRQEDWVLPFSSYNRLDRYGPKFDQALRVLAQFQAVEVGRVTRKLAPQVRAVVVGSTKVSNLAEVRALLTDFESLDGRAFAYTINRADDDTRFALVLENHKSREFSLVVAPQRFPSERPLPPTLWNIYCRSRNVGR